MDVIQIASQIQLKLQEAKNDKAARNRVTQLLRQLQIAVSQPSADGNAALAALPVVMACLAETAFASNSNSDAAITVKANMPEGSAVAIAGSGVPAVRDAAAACLAPLLRAAAPVPIAVFKDILAGSPILLTHGKIPVKIDQQAPSTNLSEEFKIDILHALMSILSFETTANTTTSTITRSAKINPSFPPIFFQTILKNEANLLTFYAAAVSAILEILTASIKEATSGGGNKFLQLASLNSLRLIIEILSPPNCARILPGLASALVLFIDESRARVSVAASVLCAAIDLLAVVIGKPCADSDGIWLDAIQYEKDEGKERPDFLDTRTLSWFNTTTTRVDQVLERLLNPVRKTRHSQNVKIRMAFLQMSFQLLNTCQRSISSDASVSVLMQCLAVYIEDDIQEVREKALHNIKYIVTDIRRRDLMTRNMAKLIREEIPHCFAGSDNDRKIDLLKLCCGYLVSLGSQNNSALYPQNSKYNDAESGGSSWVLGEDLEFNLAVGTFLDSILRHVNFSNSNIKLIEDRNIGSLAIPLLNTNDVLLTYSEFDGEEHAHYFDSNQTPDVLKNIARVLKLFAQYGNADQIFDNLIRIFEDSATVDKSTGIFLMNQFCGGLCGGTGGKIRIEDENYLAFQPEHQNYSDQNILKSLIMTYINSKILDKPTSRKELKSLSIESESKTVIKSLNSNIIASSLLLEGIAISAKHLGPGFSPFLIDTLYPVIERIGDQNRTISQTATITLSAIASACCETAAPIRESSDLVSKLIISNIDYLVNDLSLRLRYLDVYPGAPRVFDAALRVAGVEILPYLDDVFEDIITALDFNQDSSAVVLSIFGALEGLVGVLEIQEQQNNSSNVIIAAEILFVQENDENNGRKKISKEMVEFEKHFCETKERQLQADNEKYEIPKRDPFKSFKSNTEASTADSETNQNIPDENTENLPLVFSKSEQMAEKILTKSQHFITRSDPHLQSKVLRLCTKSTMLLKSKKNTLNPLLHILWPSIIRLLESPYHFVILDALELISAFAKISQEFITRRFVSDLVPRLESVLTLFTNSNTPIQPNNRSLQQKPIKRAAILSDKSSAMKDVHSIIFKVVASALETMAVAVGYIPNLQIRELCRIMDCVWPFLNESQYHERLQMLAREVTVAVGRNDANDIWLRIACVQAIKKKSFAFVMPSKIGEDGESSSKLKALPIPGFLKGRYKNDDFFKN
ncbi:TEL2-interacting protein 1, partial [Physocladia obscura]